MLKFSVKADGCDALQEKLAQACTKAEHIVATQVRKDTSPYVPFLTGSLDERTQVVGNAVVYPGPYARFLYYGKVMVDPETGSTYAPKGGTKVLTDKTLCLTSPDTHKHSRTGSRRPKPKTLINGSVLRIRR